MLQKISVAIAVLALSACSQTTRLQEGNYNAKPGALDLSQIEFKSGVKLPFTVGIGSGAFHYAGDPQNVFYTVTDRGPNIKCKDTQKVAHVANTSLCHGDKAGKVFPFPHFVPTIYKIMLKPDHSFSIIETVNLKDFVGQPISGISNPLVTSNTEKAFTYNGDKIAFDPSGLDVESIVRLSDGTFWLSDEYGPSLVHVASDGRILKRLVPQGLKNDLALARYPVEDKLPGILKWRKLNRGIESIGVSPDEKSLYFMMQSPLANPNVKTYKSSNAVRAFKLDIATGNVLGEYLYPLDNPTTFKADNAKHKRKQSDVKISELTALANDRLLILERISATTKFYVVDLNSGTNIWGRKWDAEIVSPSLEQLGIKGMANKGVQALSKSLVLNTDDRKNMPKKIEGIGLLDANTVMLINDNDFGINHTKTTAVITHFTKPVF